MAITIYLPKITLNVNGLNVPIKRHRMAEGIRKQRLQRLPVSDSLQSKKHTETASKGIEKGISCIWKWKIAVVAILILEKIDFKMTLIKRDKEGHYITIKGAIQQEDITLVSIYVPNIGAPKYINRIMTDIKGETSRHTVKGYSVRKSTRKQWP